MVIVNTVIITISCCRSSYHLYINLSILILLLLYDFKMHCIKRSWFDYLRVNILLITIWLDHKLTQSHGERLWIIMEISNIYVSVHVQTLILKFHSNHGRIFDFLPHRSYSWRRRQMKTYSTLLVICKGNAPVTHTKASDAELWCFL